MKKILAVITVLSAAGLFLFVFPSRAKIPQKEEMTVSELKAEWDRVDTEMQKLLSEDFNAHAEQALETYESIRNNKDFTYTVFKAQAGRRISLIRKKTEKETQTTTEPAVEKTETVSEKPAEKAAAPAPESGTAEKPVIAEPEPEKTKQTEESLKKAVSDKEPIKELSDEEQAAVQYNKAFLLFEKESYGHALTGFQKLLAQYGKTDFCREKKQAILGYISRSRILSENPAVTLYLCQDFEYPEGNWKGEFVDNHCHNKSKGALKSVSLDIPGLADTQTGIALLSSADYGLFPLEKGQRINFSYHIPVSIPLQLHIWDKSRKSNYFHMLSNTLPGEWQTVSIPLKEFRNVSDGLPVSRDLQGECWYLGISAESKFGHTFAVDSLTVTGEKLPSEVVYSLKKGRPGLASHLQSDHFTFNKTIAENLGRKLSPVSKSGTILLAGDAMTQWINTGIPLTSPKEMRDSRVTGSRKKCRQVADNMGTVLSEKKPEVTLIMMGLTDMFSQGGGGMTMAYDKAVSECLKHGSIPVLFGLPRLRDEAADGRIDRLNQELVKVSQRYNIPYIDTSGVLSRDLEFRYDERIAFSSPAKQELSNVFKQLYKKVNTYVTSVK